MRIHSASNWRGFSLIELMVAMLIGLLVLAGVIQVVLNSKRSFLDNQETAFIQDNTRYALDIIAKDFRSSGYRGCARNEPSIVNVIKFASINTPAGGTGALSDAFAFNNKPFVGRDSKSAADLKDPDIANFLPSGVLPDTITLRTIPNQSENVLSLHNPKSNTLTTNQPVQFNDGTPLVIVDANCQNVALLAAGTGGVASTQLKLTGNLNCSTGLTSTGEASCTSGKINTTKSLTPGSTIFPYLVNIYFIGKSNSSFNETMPALKRQYLTSVTGIPTFRTEEIAQGVEDMQITYGLNDGNGKVLNDQFVTADVVNADWNKVVAVHIVLTLRSNLPVNKSVDGDGGYIRKKVASTISLRNFGS
ncbi:MAG: prepilin-type N-terminal cleavage/methylation domain-containing protein [Moraxellaceae bacterium]|nr:MAG: prepilin-type N-terminal cleavage/methylation domain-containing protein [Moraxellaceae bacterium]